MILQCALQGRTLFATLYYRSLEVSTFLSINLEEIRLMLKRVSDAGGLQFDEVALTIFAFRAYVQEQMNTLERCELDRLNQLELVELLMNGPHRLPHLLREKAKHSTVVEVAPLEALRDIFSSQSLSRKICARPVPPRISLLAAQSAAMSEKLRGLRIAASHREDIADLTKQLSEKLESLASEYEEWLKR
jgi:hypothetical protein